MSNTPVSSNGKTSGSTPDDGGSTPSTGTATHGHASEVHRLASLAQTPGAVECRETETSARTRGDIRRAP